MKDVWLNICSKTCLPPTEIAHGPLAPWILRQIWISRNSLVFNNRTTTAEETLSKAMAGALDGRQTGKRKSHQLDLCPLRKTRLLCSRVLSYKRMQLGLRDGKLQVSVGTYLLQRELGPREKPSDVLNPLLLQKF